MDFSKYLFRCSQLSKIMCDPKTKLEKDAGELSVTAKSYLKLLYREVKYKRYQEYTSKYIEKGITQEENAITLYSRVKKTLFQKNETRLYNEYLTGEPDLFKGRDINKCDEGYDLKCSWSVFTFPFKDDLLDKQYFYQNIGYMALTGAKRWTTAYCLVNAPANLILNEKRSIWYKLDCPSDDDKTYIKKCREVEKNMIFNIDEFLKENPGFDFHCTDWKYDIPLNERIIEFTIERDADIDETINLIYNKITKARIFLMNMAYQDNGNPSILLASYDTPNKLTIVTD